MSLVTISRDLTRAVAGLRFGPPVAVTLNPLVYARRPHEAYLERFGAGSPRALLLGMNPGPFGMAQTGVPFGDVAMVRDWMGIEERVDEPTETHPKRPVQGFACPRSEVSGTRLWGWAKDRFGTPDSFFERFFVWNHCPLAFLEAGGRNRTPDKLPAAEREPLFEACDAALGRVVEALGVEAVIGVGAYAETRLRSVLRGAGTEDAYLVGRILHPSPASPAANRGWAEQAEASLRSYGLL
jgi:single-strand selective monofunctional uracil DNA glycosylase